MDKLQDKLKRRTKLLKKTLKVLALLKSYEIQRDGEKPTAVFELRRLIEQELEQELNSHSG